MKNDQIISKSKPSPAAQLVLDLGPLAVFFVVYKSVDIIAATGALMAATLASLLYTYYKTHQIAAMPSLTGVLVTVFGLLTIWLDDDYFIKIKPTIINILFSMALLGGLLLKKSPLKLVLGEAIQLQPRGWHLLTLRWAVFFLALAALNEVIWRHFSTDFWVNFKVFGMFTLTLIFTAAQWPLIKRHIIEEQQENTSGKEKPL